MWSAAMWRREHLSTQKLHDMKKDIDYIRASASLPYVSKFVELGGRKLLDGGCTDSVPVEAFMKLGFTKDVVVLTRDLEYRKKPENAWMADLVYRKYPKFAEVLKNRSGGVQPQHPQDRKAGKRRKDLCDPAECTAHDQQDFEKCRGDRKDVSGRSSRRKETDGCVERMARYSRMRMTSECDR